MDRAAPWNQKAGNRLNWERILTFQVPSANLRVDLSGAIRGVALPQPRREAVLGLPGVRAGHRSPGTLRSARTVAPGQ
jgi:hypothetical protein